MKIADDVLKRMTPLILSGQATDEQLEKAGFDLDAVLEIKTGADFNIRGGAPPIDYEIKQLGEREFRLPMTNERVDHAGDILKANWDLRVFRSNPVALWMHRTLDPIGTWRDVKKEDVKGLPGLVGTFVGAPEGNSPVADMVVALLESRVLRAVSVGFKFLQTKDIRSPEERQKIGLGPFGVYGLKQLLFESSIVSIPMNPDISAGADEDEWMRRQIDEIGAAFEDVLSRGVVTKSAVEATLPGFAMKGVGAPMTERDYAGLLRECARTFHALGAPEGSDPIVDAEDVLAAFRALGEADDPSTEGKGETLDSEPEPQGKTADHEPTVLEAAVDERLVRVLEDLVASLKSTQEAQAQLQERVASLAEEVGRHVDHAIRQADVIREQADAMAEHLRRVEDRSPTEAQDQREADIERIARAIDRRGASNGHTETHND